MKTRNSSRMVWLALLVLPAMTYSADQKKADAETIKPKPASSALPQTSALSKEKPKLFPTNSAIANPASGEQIKWQVIGGGGGSSSSTNYKVGSTIGQTAAGGVSSTNYKVNQGFWQSFLSSCCVGKRGNVNCTGTVDLGDLSALVSYLTGGGFVLCCLDAANVNGIGTVDLGDLSALVSYLTGGGFVLVNCP